MKKVIVLVLACLVVAQVFGQGKARKAHLFAEVTPFVNVNAGDIPFTDRNRLSQATTFGTSMGIGGITAPDRLLRFSASFGFRYNPQSLTFKPDNETFILRHNDISFYMKTTLSMRMKVDHGNAVIFNAGLNYFASLKNERNENVLLTQPYTDPLTGETLHNLVGIYTVNFGNTRTFGANGSLTPFTFHALMQVGFETTELFPNNRRCGVLFEFTTKLFQSTDDSPRDQNSATFYKINDLRQVEASYQFKDKYHALGINMYIDIF